MLLLINQLDLLYFWMISVGRKDEILNFIARKAMKLKFYWNFWISRQKISWKNFWQIKNVFNKLTFSKIFLEKSLDSCNWILCKIYSQCCINYMPNLRPKSINFIRENILEALAAIPGFLFIKIYSTRFTKKLLHFFSEVFNKELSINATAH